jgi:hypothetical protein
MQLLATLVLCRLHGMMECWARSEALALSWNNGQKIDVVPIVPALHHSNIPSFHCSIIPIVREAN